jgi:hypothetical protein
MQYDTRYEASSSLRELLELSNVDARTSQPNLTRKKDRVNKRNTNKKNTM